MSIAAPATDPGGDLELKLPATIGSANQLLKNSGTAGTLEFSSLVEDSSGNVGVGITPTSKFHTKGDQSGGFIKCDAAEGTTRFFVTGNDTSDVEVNLYEKAGGQRGILVGGTSEFAIKAPSSSAPLKFYTTPSGGSQTERMCIDANGYVTKPAQPYAKIHFNAGSAGGVDSSSLTKQDSVSASTVRNGMSHTTGRITVPIAGTYLIYNHNNNYEGGNAHMAVRVNGSNINGGNAQNGDNDSTYWKSIDVMTVVDLSASDYVESFLYGKQDNATWNSLIVTLLS